MDRHDLAAALASHLKTAIAARRVADADPARAARRAALRAWQSKRLAHTYADLSANPLYRPATTFFLSDLYSTRDLSRRDAELERALPALVRLSPMAALEPLELAFELDGLSEVLDQRLAEALYEHGATPSGEATVEQYAAAYRATNDREGRTRQIELVVGVGRALDRVAHGRLLTAAVKMMNGPAHAAGFGELHDFLERGLTAFRHMRSAREFLDIVEYRERRILARIWDETPEPFDVG